MDPAYIARTRHHQFLLDEQGVCYQVCRLPNAGDGGSSEGATRCVGAQFVASIDPSEPGFLRQKPTVGVPLLFAKVGENGKICVVRTGVLEHFEPCEGREIDRPTEPRFVRGETSAYGSGPVRVPPPTATSPAPYQRAPSGPSTDRTLPPDDGDHTDTVTDLVAVMSARRHAPLQAADDEPTLTGFPRPRSTTHGRPEGYVRPTLLLVKGSR